MSENEKIKAGFFAELQRRRVLRTLALYILGAWVLMQVADVLLPGLGLPEESIRYLLFATIAGFPVALIFAWFFDITSAGIQRTAPPGAGESAEPEPLRGTDYALLGALAIVLGVVVYGVVGGVVEVPLPTAEDPVAAPAPQRDGPPMVGVLPFAHMGSSEDGDFFASGVHDDLLTRLAKVQGLRVISRTSVLNYAGTTKKIPEIGRELGADAILEGGVRIAGGQIRINAQLIDARSDEHLWAETYDREFTASNIFAVQSGIARAIAAAMAATLSPEEDRELSVIPTQNMGAYRAYHEIMQWRANNHLDEQNQAYFIDGLERAYTLDPEFTWPMVEVVKVLSLQVYFNRGREELPRIEGLIDRIGKIAPDSADHYTVQALYFYYVLRDLERADELIQVARERAPSDTGLIDIQSWIKRRQGDFEGYLGTAREMYALEPSDPDVAGILAGRLTVMHRYDEALELAEKIEQPNLRTRLLREQLRLMRHGDLKRYEMALSAMVNDAPSPDRRDSLLSELWESQVMRRDYVASQATVDRIADRAEGATPPLRGVPNYDRLQLVQHLLTGNEGAAAALAETLKPTMGLTGMSATDYPSRLMPLDAALLLVAEGHRDVAFRLLSGLWSDPRMDRAMWLSNRMYICQMLALLDTPEAAPEAVACLENSLTEPSTALPYTQTQLPFYDPVRERADFQAVLSELKEAGWRLVQ